MLYPHKTRCISVFFLSSLRSPRLSWCEIVSPYLCNTTPVSQQEPFSSLLFAGVCRYPMASYQSIAHHGWKSECTVFHSCVMNMWNSKNRDILRRLLKKKKKRATPPSSTLPPKSIATVKNACDTAPGIILTHVQPRNQPSPKNTFCH